jgi:hypothetical protein
MRRQQVLIRDDQAALWVILDEWVLRRPVGGRHVMLEQANRTPDPAIAVRDSKDPDGPQLAFTVGDWQAFLRQVKDGRPGPA